MGENNQLTWDAESWEHPGCSWISRIAGKSLPDPIWCAEKPEYYTPNFRSVPLQFGKYMQGSTEWFRSEFSQDFKSGLKRVPARTICRVNRPFSRALNPNNVTLSWPSTPKECGSWTSYIRSLCKERNQRRQGT